MTIEEQIKNKCIHFNGISGKTCRAGINYSDVEEKGARPIKIPCLLKNQMSGGKCEHAKFPTDEEAKIKAEDIIGSGQKTLLAMIAIKEHYKKTKILSGIIDCPNCKGPLSYGFASNGHARGSCPQCGVSFVE